MANLNVDIKDINFGALLKLPPLARKVMAGAPAVIIIALFVFLAILPKNKEIKALEQEIAEQKKEIAKSQGMAARLEELKAENEKLKKKLKELEEQLPGEHEISSLLKQVSDLGLDAGLQIITWKPAQRRNHPSQIVYEVPVTVTMKGSYHRLGRFFSSLTHLDRIVNINDIVLNKPAPKGEEVILDISFNAVTFTAVEEGGILQ